MGTRETPRAWKMDPTAKDTKQNEEPEKPCESDREGHPEEQTTKATTTLNATLTHPTLQFRPPGVVVGGVKMPVQCLSAMQLLEHANRPCRSTRITKAGA